MDRFECLGLWNPFIPFISGVELFSFSDDWTSGVIRMGSQYEIEKGGIIMAQEELIGMHFVQFVCVRHWKGPVSSNFEVERFSTLGSLFTFYRAGVDEKSIGVLRLDSPSESAPFGSLFAKLATFHLLG